MGLNGTRIYVGFGFGAIQVGLFLYEAFRTSSFRRLIVAEILPEVIDDIRQADGCFTVNIAYPDRVEPAKIGPIEIENPFVASDRKRLMAAIVEAEEIGTAVPSVAYYTSEGASSLHRLLAAGLRQKVAQGGPRAVVYTAENHNHAAEMLQEAVMQEIPVDERDTVRAHVCFLNTVIAKMSGLVADPQDIRSNNLTPVTPGSQRAFLVEVFNQILISRIKFEAADAATPTPYQRGISVFEEKTDLLPFEEAKFYGHNAVHALAAYIGTLRNVYYIADLRTIPGVWPFFRAALLEESGAALIQKYNGIDPLFTPEGFQHFTDDLLARMFNPYLRDTVGRVSRDPARKLGWDDRLIGSIRLVLQQNITPRRYAFGVAAALASLDESIWEEERAVEKLLSRFWQDVSPSEREKTQVLDLIKAERQRLRRWRDSGYQDLEQFFN